MIRRHPISTIAAIILALGGLFYFSQGFDSSASFELRELAPTDDGSKNTATDLTMSVESLAAGKPIMAKMANMTVRAEVGNAGWKLIHTILAQYPEEPTQEDRETLHTFFKFWSRVYPCRECAEHFQELLRKFPPQLSSRKAAVMWGCDAHNKVNKRLGKSEFDCAYIFDKYDCGCGDASQEKDDEKSAVKSFKLEPVVASIKGG